MYCPRCGELCQCLCKEWVCMNPRCLWSEGDSVYDEDDYDPLDSGTGFSSVDRTLVSNDSDDDIEDGDDDPIIG